MHRYTSDDVGTQESPLVTERMQGQQQHERQSLREVHMTVTVV